jgi:dolichol-phosphate mannosyltransferase
MRYTVITPTYNEAANIGTLVAEVFKRVPDVSVLVVDDNSPDGTSDVVRKLQAQYPNLSLFLRERKEGLGKAYISAFKRVLNDTDAVIMMDADLSHHPEYLPKLIAAAEHADVVVGSRYMPGGATQGWELWRRILSRCGNWYARTVTGLPVRDCTAGFMLVKADFLRKVDFSQFDLSGYAFLIELKYLLWKAGARMAQVPIIFRNRIGGESKISSHIINEGILAPWKIRFRKQV